MGTKKKLDLAGWAIKSTLKAGADEASASITNQRSVDIEFRDKKLEKLSESTQNSLTLQIYSDHRFSSHTTNDLRKESLEKFICARLRSFPFRRSRKCQRRPSIDAQSFRAPIAPR